jgi:hypothetical protein
MKHFTMIVAAAGMVIFLSSCATGKISNAPAYSVSAAVVAPSPSPSANAPVTQSGAAIATATPQTNSPIGRSPTNSYLTHVADVLVYGNSRLAPNEQGASFREIIKRRLASGYYDNAISRACDFQSHVSFDQDKINMFETFAR